MTNSLSLPSASAGPRAVAARPQVAMAFGGAGLSRDQVELLKRTVAKGVTDDELALFVHVANHAKLDPFAKQIHAVKRWDGKQRREVMSIQTGIDGFRLIAARTKAHAGTDEAVFEEKDGKPVKATVTVWKVVAGLRVAFTASARWDEYVQTYKDRETGAEKMTGLWAKMPYVMLAKCAEAQALRKAFPADLSGIYAEEEIGTMDVAPAPAVAPGEPEATPTIIEATPVEAPAAEPTPAPDATPSPDVWRRDVLASFAEFRAACEKGGSLTEFEAVKTKAGVRGKAPPQLTPSDVDAINDAMPAPFRLVL